MGAATPDSVVTTARAGDVLVVTIDNPPGQRAGRRRAPRPGRGHRGGRGRRSRRGRADRGRGRNFIAGADIREFGKPPRCRRRCPRCATASKHAAKPVVAAHCTAPRSAAAWKWRWRRTTAWRCPPPSWACPKCTLGLLPGSGGTQRAPRLIGRQGRARADAERPPRSAPRKRCARPGRPPGRGRRRAGRRPGLCPRTAGRRTRPCAARATPRPRRPRRRARAALEPRGRDREEDRAACSRR